MKARMRLRVPLNFFKIENMEETSVDSQQGSNLLRLLGIVVASFIVFQSLIPIPQLTTIPLAWITKASWRKYPVDWWGRFWAVVVVFVLFTGSYYAMKAGIEADRAKAKLEWMRLSPAEVVVNRQVIREQTFSALLMDPLNWRRWMTWSETKQMLGHSDFE